MAYNISKFYCARGLFNCNASLSAPVQHIYNTEDTLEIVGSPGYFPPYFGFSAENIRDGDFLMVRADGNGGIVYIIETNPLNVIPFLFIDPNPPVSQTVTTQSNQFTGIWVDSPDIQIIYVETGILVQLTYPTVLESAILSGVITLAAPPFRFPGTNIKIPCIVSDNGVPVQGIIDFEAGGSFTISPLSGSFSGLGLCGVYGFTFSYNTFV